MQAKLEHLRSVAHSLVVAMEMECGELSAAQELERKAAMLCQEFRTWVFNYSDVIEALNWAERCLRELTAGALGEDEETQDLLATCHAVLQKAGMRDE